MSSKSSDGNPKRALIVVDMSIEQVANLPSPHKENIIASIRNLASTPGWELKIDSRLWIGSPTESTLSLAYPECGTSLGVAESHGAGLIPELHDLGLVFVKKKHFSSFVDSDLEERLDRAEIESVVIAGINTDFCIFLTAMDAFARCKLNTVIIEEAVGSYRGNAAHEEGIKRLKEHLPEGSVRTLSAYNS